MITRFRLTSFILKLTKWILADHRAGRYYFRAGRWNIGLFGLP